MNRPAMVGACIFRDMVRAYLESQGGTVLLTQTRPYQDEGQSAARVFILFQLGGRTVQYGITQILARHFTDQAIWDCAKRLARVACQEVSDHLGTSPV